MRSSISAGLLRSVERAASHSSGRPSRELAGGGDDVFAGSPEVSERRRALTFGLVASLFAPGCVPSSPRPPLAGGPGAPPLRPTPAVPHLTPTPPPAAPPTPIPTPPPPTWTVIPAPQFVEASGGVYNLSDTLPPGVRRGGTFAVDPSGTPLPPGMSLSSDGILSVGTAVAGETVGVVFSYTEP
ncbi:MAG: hypothetical protein IT384_09485 [Deltaproteobacteria bacterium]|nr:hypothetical protein [Deltaproteobacteria bacterium]